MSKYTAYLDYKSSGAEWLGNIPEDWIAIPLKRLASFTTGMTPPTTITKYYSSDRTEFGWIRPEDIRETSEFVSSSKFLTKLGWKTQRVVLAKSSLICCIGTIGKTGYLLKSATTNQQITAATFKFSPKYYFYVLLAARNELEQMATGNVVQILNSERLSRLQVPLPTIYEAENIANFLDHETAKIDTLIGKQQQLIKLLKEKRQAVISHAVTKGIPNKEHQNVPMKDSGVEWLGEVPAHWVVTKIKYITSLFEQGWSPQCDSRTAEVNEYGILKVGCVNHGIFKPLENKALPKELEPRLQYIINKDDLLISRANTKELVGSAAVVTKDYENLILCDKLYRLKLNSNVSPELLSLYLSISAVRGQIELGASGASHSMQNIGQDVIKELPCFVIPHEESLRLLEYIKGLLNKFSLIINKSELQIRLLQERRTALISAAVTGKIDVRNWEHPND
ncbi:restriction endonuclease subunit S [Pseudoalteromonas nigrifaciens]|uniref:restriction endonuclease subunit S n=1 Tax=Pseudoalteromonas nigrifaciens TaxID=28109 RepID=UPI0030CA5491